MWNAIEVPEISRAELLEMTRPQNQPALKRIRKHLLFEASGFALIVVLYFLFFHESFYTALLLITGLGLYLLHETLVYRFFNLPQKGNSIPETQRIYRNRLKNMTIITIILRGLGACVLVFFLSFAVKLDGARFWVLRGTAFLLTGQLVFVMRIWLNRLSHVIGKVMSYHPLNFLLGEDDGPSQGLDQYSKK